MIAAANENEPSPNGRTAAGQFAKGNRGGPGNPYARRVASIRAHLIKTVKPKDVRDIAKALITKAKSGDVPAIKEFFDRLLGKAPQTISLPAGDRVDELGGSDLLNERVIEFLRTEALAADSKPGVVCQNGKPGQVAVGKPSSGNGSSHNGNGNGNGKH